MTDYAHMLGELEAGTLPAEGFSHKDHIGVAYAALARYGYFEALATVAAGIRRAALAAGAPDKFNATITAAYMSLIAERMDRQDYADAQDFIAHNPDLLRGTPLAALYSRARLDSDRARRVALMPDLTTDRASG